MTPIQFSGGFYFKRDDLFVRGGANGGKVRIMLELAKDAKGLIACGDRISTQIPRAAMVAKFLKLPCRIHTASGQFTQGMFIAQDFGAEIVQHSPGYLTVVRKRAFDDSIKTGFTHIPWGLECEQAVKITAEQIETIPSGVDRIVVPVGSGMTLAGILHGLKNKIPVVGVCLGAEVEKRLDKYAPVFWRNMVHLVRSEQDFHDESPLENQNFCGVSLDPVYESKCVPFLKKGDLLWIVGIR